MNANNLLQQLQNLHQLNNIGFGHDIKRDQRHQGALMSALSIIRQRPAPEDLQMLKSILERICLDDMHSAGLELTRMAEAMINAPWLHQTSFDLNALLEMGETLMREAQVLTIFAAQDHSGH